MKHYIATVFTEAHEPLSSIVLQKVYFGEYEKVKEKLLEDVVAVENENRAIDNEEPQFEGKAEYTHSFNMFDGIEVDDRTYMYELALVELEEV
jgi:hypothetical protein